MATSQLLERDTRALGSPKVAPGRVPEPAAAHMGATLISRPASARWGWRGGCSPRPPPPQQGPGCLPSSGSRGFLGNLNLTLHMLVPSVNPNNAGDGSQLTGEDAGTREVEFCLGWRSCEVAEL